MEANAREKHRVVTIDRDRDTNCPSFCRIILYLCLLSRHPSCETLCPANQSIASKNCLDIIIKFSLFLILKNLQFVSEKSPTDMTPLADTHYFTAIIIALRSMPFYIIEARRGRSKRDRDRYRDLALKCSYITHTKREREIE